MAFAGGIVLEIVGGVDADGGYGEAVFYGRALFLPVAVEVEVPFLQVGAGVDMGAETAQLALHAEHALEIGPDIGVTDKRAEILRLAIQERVEPHIADGV